jgi:hypothetical protein
VISVYRSYSIGTLYVLTEWNECESTRTRRENNNSDLQSTYIVRTKRVKEARDEAKKEIAEYKASKEDEFKKFEAEVWDIERLISASKAQ